MPGHAVLVGCNYKGVGTLNELLGCINDVAAMRETLIDRFEFRTRNIATLTDAPIHNVRTQMPTKSNIMHALRDMIDSANSGDVLLFHFSGHGTLRHEKHEDAIVCHDHQYIDDREFRTLVNRVPNGASFTIISDSCHSGGLIDKEKEQMGPHTMSNSSSSIHKARGVHIDGHKVNRNSNRNVRLHPDNGILLSGCQLTETSTDVTRGDKPHGAFTNALLTVLKNHKDPISNFQLVTRTRKVLHDQRFSQHPCLYCSDSNSKASFLEEGIEDRDVDEENEDDEDDGEDEDDEEDGEDHEDDEDDEEKGEEEDDEEDVEEVEDEEDSEEEGDDEDDEDTGEEEDDEEDVEEGEDEEDEDDGKEEEEDDDEEEEEDNDDEDDEESGQEEEDEEEEEEYVGRKYATGRG